MDSSPRKDHGRWEREQGFTLPEVLVTILILGILMGIASSSWFGVIESRAVDSATNQVAADLRLAHTRATNQLVKWGVTNDLTTYLASYPGLTLPAGVTTGDYYLIRIPPFPDPLVKDDIIARNLPSEGADTEIDPSTPLAMTFDPSGAANTVGSGVSTVRIHVKDDSYNARPRHDIEVNTTTSRVRIDP